MDDQLEKWEEKTIVEPTFKPGQDSSKLGKTRWDPDAWVEQSPGTPSN